MILTFIRHFATPGNQEGRYIGATDEPLAPIDRLPELPRATAVYVSPLRRCRETAALLFPGIVPVVVPDFRECDFGAFEGKNARELAADLRYQAWIDSMGALPFPGGESREAFSRRTVAAFDALTPTLVDGAAIVAHGGTLMAILSQRARPVRDYYAYHVQNGGGFRTQWDGSTLTVIQSF